MAIPANAATTVQDYSFRTMIGLEDDNLVAGPSGSLELTFDDVTDVYTLTAFDLLIGGTTFNTANTFFAYNPIDGGGYVGDSLTPYGVFGKDGRDDFSLRFNVADPSAGAGPYSFIYTEGAGTNYWGTAYVTATSGGVPEPSSWAMMLLGFCAIGANIRRRKPSGALFG